MRKRGYGLVLALGISLCLIGGCGQTKQEKDTTLKDSSTQDKKQEDASEKQDKKQEDSSEKDAEDMPQIANEDMRSVVTAIKNTSALTSFQIDTAIHLSLEGSYINLETDMNSLVKIRQDKSGDGLQMYSETSSDLDEQVSRGYYQQGWFYTDDKNGKNKEEKSQDEVWEMVTEITDLVVDAAGQIEEVTVSRQGEETVYVYEIPSYLAEDYLEKLAESAAAESTPLKGATADVDTLTLTSVVDEENLLISQKMEVSGTIKKAIFKVPVIAEVNASFTSTEDTEIEKPDW